MVCKHIEKPIMQASFVCAFRSVVLIITSTYVCYWTHIRTDFLLKYVLGKRAILRDGQLIKLKLKSLQSPCLTLRHGITHRCTAMCARNLNIDQTAVACYPQGNACIHTFYSYTIHYTY